MNNKLIVIALVLSAGLCFSQNIGVIPQPQSVERAEGLFEWSRNTAISVRNTDGSPCNRSSFKTNFIEQIGNLVLQGWQSKLKRITYQFVEKINADENAEQAYRMEIRPDEIPA